MSDDIVTRLNIDAAWIETCASGVYRDIGLTLRDAVDEIERLRETVQNFLMQAGQDACDIKRLREELVQAKYGIEDMYKHD